MEKANKSGRLGENTSELFAELDNFFTNIFKSDIANENINADNIYEVSKELAINQEEISENTLIFAKELFNQFSAFITVGFSRPEAFRLIQTIIANSIKGGN